MNRTIAQIVMSLNARIRASREVAEWIFGEHIDAPGLHRLLVGAFTTELTTECLAAVALLDGVELDTRDVLAAFAILAQSETGDSADTAVRRRTLAAIVVEGVRRGITPGNVGIASCVEAAFQAVMEAAEKSPQSPQYATAKREWSELWTKNERPVERDPSRSAAAAVMAVLSSDAAWFRDAAYQIHVFDVVPGDPHGAIDSADVVPDRLTTTDRATLAAWQPVDAL